MIQLSVPGVLGDGAMERALGIGAFMCYHAWQIRGAGDVCHAQVASQACNSVRSCNGARMATIPGSRSGAAKHLRSGSSWNVLPGGRSVFGHRPAGPELVARVFSEEQNEAAVDGAMSPQGVESEHAGRECKDAPCSVPASVMDGIQVSQSGDSRPLAASGADGAAVADVVVGQAGGDGAVQIFIKWRSSIQEWFAFKNLLRSVAKAFQEPSEGLSSTQGRREGDDGIDSVTRDDLDPLVQWEQRKKDVIAEQERPALTSPGFSFSAAGLLFPYHLGVCQCLMEHGFLTEDTPLAGSSAGALVCAVVAGGVSMEDALAATKELAEDCRTSGTAFRLGAVLRAVLEKVLPEDAHIRSSGRIRVAITQVFRSPRGLLVDKFDSKEDLINALFASCFIPGYLAPRPVTIFRDRFCVDGGISLFMPPTAAESTVRVCAFPSAAFGLKGIGISPDCSPTEPRAPANQLLSWALEPASDEVLDELFRQGQRDALVWVKNAQQSSQKDPLAVA